MRRTLTIVFLVGGLVLMVVSYFFLAAPWGASGVKFSNPRLPFAATLFLIGILAAVGSAVVYEVFPDKSEGRTET